MSKHHRKERSRGGTSAPENISEVQDVRHRGWHMLKGGMSPEQLAIFITKYMLDPDYEFICRPKLGH